MTSTRGRSANKLGTMSLSEAWKEISTGNLAIVNSSVLGNLSRMHEFHIMFPFIVIFNISAFRVVYAVGLIHNESVFIYAEPAGPLFGIEGFKKRAYETFKNATLDYVKSYRKTVQLTGNQHWNVTINTSSNNSSSIRTSIIRSESVTSTNNAYIAGHIYWNSYDTWAPQVRLKLGYIVYKLQDINPDYDYYTVVQHTEVYPGYYLNYEQHNDDYGFKWEINKVINYFNTDYDTQNVFDLLSYKPNYDLDYYNDEESHTISYTIGTGGISVSVSYQLRCFKLSVVSTGYDWAKWIVDLNREDYWQDGVGREPITVEPSYLFALNLNQLSNEGQASQRLYASVDMTGNNIWQPDDHWQGTVYITWTWYG
ncbi:MAG: hypothetical protein GSR79_00795 [Desulfurococcales archaeon]|nr:hypothetical protein [Desulfurococcales archaeon]